MVELLPFPRIRTEAQEGVSREAVVRRGASAGSDHGGTACYVVLKVCDRLGGPEGRSRRSSCCEVSWHSGVGLQRRYFKEWVIQEFLREGEGELWHRRIQKPEGECGLEGSVVVAVAAARARPLCQWGEWSAGEGGASSSW